MGAALLNHVLHAVKASSVRHPRVYRPPCISHLPSSFPNTNPPVSSQTIPIRTHTHTHTHTHNYFSFVVHKRMHASLSDNIWPLYIIQTSSSHSNPRPSSQSNTKSYQHQYQPKCVSCPFLYTSLSTNVLAYDSSILRKLYHSI